MPCSPLPSTPALSPPSTFLCQAQLPPPPYIHPPPTRPVATAVLLQFMGSLRQLSTVEGEGGEVEGDRDGERQQGKRHEEMREVERRGTRTIKIY